MRHAVKPVEERHELVDERLLVRSRRRRVADADLGHEHRLAVAGAKVGDVRLVVVRVRGRAVDMTRDGVDLAAELVALVHELVEPGCAEGRATVGDGGTDEGRLAREGLHVRHPEVGSGGRVYVRLR